ncbi:MAG: HD domain-containing phosphohydrolase [Candidatus Omnitrophota bacterium]
MKKHFIMFGSFRWKITATLILLMCFSGVVGNFLVYDYASKAQFEQLRDKLKIIAQAIALTLDTDALLRIPLDESGIESPSYKAIAEKLLRVKEVDPSLAYIYILKKTEYPGILRFIIDLHPCDYPARLAPALPGEAYDASGFPELARAFGGPAADKKITADKWGVFLSGYAPVRDSSGSVIAVLGIDMTANDVYNTRKEARRRSAVVLLSGIALSIVLGFLISARITAPINKLVEGTRHISSGDMKYRVKVEGADEISELASAFNDMASNLLKARERLVDYFYRAIQTLVRVLESRDAYTKGHSDRVADYAVKIAVEMGLPAQKVELVKEAALLHDIGKLGVQEMILSKKSELSEEDRESIRKHPLIGEELLKPVSLNKEMLTVVREHHERYDGKGYPDGLTGDKIDMLAAIVSVADSYDAMTSHRTYMKNFTRDEAIEQLKKNSGSQFNPGVVEAFVRVLGK